ncbi:hypothetical protein [Microbacterium allomyrinae]|uniref:Uncharacterized protein n=1 Tax=Microbacterium allomyrinae TaxID=2830666 RepID=A0A9X1LVR4_9MICO|nr:hypothetical protein [Microbacterium allomyrinae]MCC2032686.1 hypothetical protein [Microbacterium allomyrinae]
MVDHQERDDGTLDQLLGAAAPSRTIVTPAIEDELARMTVAAKDEGRSADRPRRAKRTAAVGVILAVLLGGAGAATAATIGEWPWWAEKPDGKYFYTAPSGEACEVRIGKFESSDPAVEAIMRDVQGWEVALDDGAIAAAFEAEKETHRQFEADMRAQGNEPYVQSEAVLYELAIYRVIQEYADDKLAAQGVDLREVSNGPLELGWSGEIKCAEATGE